MNEKDIVAGVLSGNEAAIGMLIQKHERLVNHMVHKVVQHEADREEICQDVFMKVIENLASFHFQSKLSTWVATIAYRQAINFARKKKLNLEDLDKVAFKVAVEDHTFETADRNKFVMELIDQLPAQYKLVLTMYFLEGFSYAEIADIAKMPDGTVKSYLHRAKQMLKKSLEPYLTQEIDLL